ncbi:membrane protein [soil metagenome]
MPRLNKVPQVTLAFWVIKILATTIGETGADYLAFKMGLGVVGTAAVMTGLLLVALVFQFRARRYSPILYWLSVVLLSVVGTLATDIASDRFGISLIISTATFAVLLVMTFGVWFVREETVSIHQIDSRRREMFYWTAILFTFALGTAAGDLVAEKLQWGYGLSAVIFGLAITAAAVAYFVFKVSFDLVFWIAYVLTRPFGASMGDLLSQPTASGGLGFGAERVSLVFLVAILGLVAGLSLSSRRGRRPSRTD